MDLQNLAYALTQVAHNFGAVTVVAVPLFKRLSSLGGLADEKYPATELEKTLSQFMGDVALSQLIKDCAITAYDIAERAVVVFNSRDNRNGKSPGKDFYVRDVARAAKI